MSKNDPLTLRRRQPSAIKARWSSASQPRAPGSDGCHGNPLISRRRRDLPSVWFQTHPRHTKGLLRLKGSRGIQKLGVSKNKQPPTPPSSFQAKRLFSSFVVPETCLVSADSDFARAKKKKPPKFCQQMWRRTPLSSHQQHGAGAAIFGQQTLTCRSIFSRPLVLSGNRCLFSVPRLRLHIFTTRKISSTKLAKFRFYFLSLAK